MAPRAGVARLCLGPLPRAPVANANVAAADKAVAYVSVDAQPPANGSERTSMAGNRHSDKEKFCNAA
jgi:hypothetical protein